MSIIQNYVGLDGRIEAIVRSLMGDVDVDLTDYYTKEEVDALIASGGTGTQIDYNDLLNRPIIEGIIQSNLDMKNYLLLKNGTTGSDTVYLPTVSDDTVTFDKKVRAPNLVTAENITPLLQDVEEEIYTNVYTISQMNEKLQLKADAANVYDKDYINTEFINVRNEMSYKADSNDVYPKTETYNRTEIDDMISGSVIPIDAYTKEETNNLLNFKADKAHTYTKEEISNFGLGTIITTKTDPQSQLQKLSIANHTELQKLYIGEEDSGMSFRFIESEVSYPEVMRILGNERTLRVTQYALNAQMGITTNELLADNIYTKEEVDALIAGGGGGGTNDYNQLINRPIIDGIVQSNLDMNGNSITKLYNIDASNNAFTISNPSSFKLSEWFKVENYENVRTDITTDKLLHINAPHILLNGELDNVYTKSASDARVRELFAELMNRTVQIQTLNTKNLLLYPKSTEGWSSDVFSNIYMSGSTVDDARMLIGFEDAYILLTKDTTTFDTPKSVFGIAPYNINMSQDTEADKIIFQSEQKPLEIKAPSITFTGTLENVYTKDDINNFGLGSIITTKIDSQTKIQKLYIGEEDEGMSFRFIESEVSYPEVMRILGNERTLRVTQYKLNAQMGIT